ncbi:hypothetical protein [Acidithiobacillus ferrivorans]|nr:hypothetical protein [Acidithiobacillus ferrivorans]
MSDPMLTFKAGDYDSPSEGGYGWVLSEGIALLDRIKSRAQQIKSAHTE